MARSSAVQQHDLFPDDRLRASWRGRAANIRGMIENGCTISEIASHYKCGRAELIGALQVLGLPSNDDAPAAPHFGRRFCIREGCHRIFEKELRTQFMCGDCRKALGHDAYTPGATSKLLARGMRLGLVESKS